MYIIKNYFTDKKIDCTDDFSAACIICQKTDDSVLTDENGNTFLYNIELPF